MASDTAIRTPSDTEEAAGRGDAGAPVANPRVFDVRAVWRALAVSRLTRIIILANLVALAVLVIGVLALSEMRRSLVEAKVDNLRSQGEFIASLLADTATVGAPRPMLLPDQARRILSRLFVPEGVRVRLFDETGALVADSFLLNDEVVVNALPPPGAEPRARRSAPPLLRGGSTRVKTVVEEVAEARLGEVTWGERTGDDGERVVSVSVPLQRVSAVLGVVTVESAGVDAILAAERRALAPFIAVAVAVTVITSALLTVFIAHPIRRLARAADRVRQHGPRRARLPDLSARRDEIGDLSVSLAAMTGALAERIDAIEQFAADVAHELKNPLTSIRSAIETLPNVHDTERRQKLLALIQHDVGRIDRLITDISNASRMDAEIARTAAEPLTLAAFLQQIVELYAAAQRDGEVDVVLAFPSPLADAVVMAQAGPLGQVFRNLIDNARTFSPPTGQVMVGVTALNDAQLGEALRVTVDDEGPGVAEENLETIFTRFYTERPKGAAFGSHSGLGLAIARQIVDAHGGRIWAENRPASNGVESGARFVVLLPRAGA